MLWSEVRDKSGKCDIRADLSILKDVYDTQEVQEMIDKRGAKAFCEIANAKLQNRSKGRAFVYIIGDQDKLIDYHFETELIE